MPYYVTKAHMERSNGLLINQLLLQSFMRDWIRILTRVRYRVTTRAQLAGQYPTARSILVKKRASYID